MQGLRQEISLKQELQLQPQQILRSELIQLPILELGMRVRAELEENPFLDEAEELELDPAEDDKKPEEESDNESSDEEENNREVDWEDFLNDSDHWEYRNKGAVSNEERTEIPQADSLTLRDHLMDQLHLDSFDETGLAIGEEIIGNISPDGYLEVELETISEERGIDLEIVEDVHRRITMFEPVGICARDLRECLLVQLKLLRPPSPITERMIEFFWEDFKNKRFEILSNKLEVPLDEIKDAFMTVTRLNPKPGEGYFNEKQNYVIPDLVVVKVDGDFEVYLNDGDIPNFNINSTYRKLFLNKKDTEKKVKEYLSRKLESARWFINAIHQRRTTMIRTMRAIVARQGDFFENGANYLKPMILADIAEDISMDISTISRVTNGKYVQTDWGVFELKYFFTEKMSTDSGAEVSNRVIKQKLSDIIDAESKKKPYSDQELTDLLNEAGFQIKRRTVAKYREQLRIPVKRLRREI